MPLDAFSANHSIRKSEVFVFLRVINLSFESLTSLFFVDSIAA